MDFYHLRENIKKQLLNTRLDSRQGTVNNSYDEKIVKKLFGQKKEK